MRFSRLDWGIWSWTFGISPVKIVVHGFTIKHWDLMKDDWQLRQATTNQRFAGKDVGSRRNHDSSRCCKQQTLRYINKNWEFTRNAPGFEQEKWGLKPTEVGTERISWHFPSALEPCQDKIQALEKAGAGETQWLLNVTICYLHTLTSFNII